MISNDEIEKKKKELWKIQLQLNKFVGETETELDPSIKKVLKNVQTPDWFNSGIVFSPLILALDIQVKTLEDEIAVSQETLKELYQNKKSMMKQVETKLEKEIVDLYKQIDAINSEIEEIQNGKQVDTRDFLKKQYQAYYEAEINRYREEISIVKKEDQELANTIQAYLEEMEISTNQVVAACEEHKKNLLLLKRYKQQINEMVFAKKIAQKSSEKLASRTEILQNTVNKLKAMKQDNDRVLLELQKDQEDYEVICTQYQKVQKSIQASQMKQEEVLNEMIKAVELTESSSASVQMYQNEVQMLEAEIERLNLLINSVDTNLNNMISDFDKNAKKYFSIINDQVNSRIDLLKSEQIKLLHEKDVIQQQIEISKQKSSVISPNIMAPDFLNSNSASYVLKLKDDVVKIISEKEKIFKENAECRKRIAQNNEKLLTNGYHKRKTFSKLQYKRQQHEIDISMLRSNLKALLQKNGAIFEDNEKVRCYIDQVYKSSTFSLSNALQEKEERIQKIQALIDEENAQHQANVQNIEQEISKFKLATEHYSNEKRQNEKDHLLKSKERNANFQSSKQKVKELKTVIQRNLDEILKGQSLLKDAQDQIDYLANEINNLLKKERHQTSLMNDAKLDQIAIATDIERYMEVEKKLDDEIEKEKKKLFLLDNDKQYNVSDDEPVVDPL